MSASEDASGSGPAPAAMTVEPVMSPPRWAMTTFVVLFVMNLLDYIDRWVLTGVLPNIQADLHLDNTQGGWLVTLFLISLTADQPDHGITRPIDIERTWLLGLGVGVWSLATLATGLATN